MPLFKGNSKTIQNELVDCKLSVCRSEIQTDIDDGDLERHVDACGRMLQQFPTMAQQAKGIAPIEIGRQLCQIYGQADGDVNIANRGGEKYNSTFALKLGSLKCSTSAQLQDKRGMRPLLLVE
ncbi:hypothetical protein ANN_05336 [Periplaneta americana]|uniref:Uncharacterized protein n=1 Tax=Periplaneta americana TaxID=6978 RepID=A0ABQ8TC56_PERAM|nr:hypothetical protein ANN_05336 [Periplaneta americana]